MPARMTRSDGAEMLTAAELQRQRKNQWRRGYKARRLWGDRSKGWNRSIILGPICLSWRLCWKHQQGRPAGRSNQKAYFYTAVIFHVRRAFKLLQCKKNYYYPWYLSNQFFLLLFFCVAHVKRFLHSSSRISITLRRKTDSAITGLPVFTKTRPDICGLVPRAGWTGTMAIAGKYTNPRHKRKIIYPTGLLPI